MGIKQEVMQVFKDVIAEEGGNKSAAAIRLGVKVVTFWDWVSNEDKRRATDGMWDALDAAGAHIYRNNAISTPALNARVDLAPHMKGTVSLKAGTDSSGRDAEIARLKDELAECKAKVSALTSELESERGRREFAERIAMNTLEAFTSKDKQG